jgi:hypothetical protein
MLVDTETKLLQKSWKVALKNKAVQNASSKQGHDKQQMCIEQSNRKQTSHSK